MSSDTVNVEETKRLFSSTVKVSETQAVSVFELPSGAVVTQGYFESSEGGKLQQLVWTKKGASSLYWCLREWALRNSFN